MVKQKKRALAVYCILFYGLWTAIELAIYPWMEGNISLGWLCQLLKSGAVKNLVWTLPALLLIRRCNSEMYVKLEDMFRVPDHWLRYLPLFLLCTVHILLSSALLNDCLMVNEAFGIAEWIVVLFVGITEEAVFRGWLLNAAVCEDRKWLPVLLNALAFLLIHFPVWIKRGVFAANFANFNFLGILILSVIFSWTFIRSRGLWIPILLHMYWDLLCMMFL